MKRRTAKAPVQVPLGDRIGWCYPKGAEPQLPPGSDAAIAEGCTCPVSNNHRGFGIYVGDLEMRLWWHSKDCPLHGWDGDEPGGRDAPSTP